MEFCVQYVRICASLSTIWMQASIFVCHFFFFSEVKLYYRLHLIKSNQTLWSELVTIDLKVQELFGTLLFFSQIIISSQMDMDILAVFNTWAHSHDHISCSCFCTHMFGFLVHGCVYSYVSFLVLLNMSNVRSEVVGYLPVQWQRNSIHTHNLYIYFFYFLSFSSRSFHFTSLFAFRFYSTFCIFAFYSEMVLYVVIEHFS